MQFADAGASTWRGFNRNTPLLTAPLIPTAPIWEGRAQDWPHSMEEGPGLPTEKSAACSLSRAGETEPHPCRGGRKEMAG